MSPLVAAGTATLVVGALGTAAVLWRSETLNVYARDGMRWQPQAALGNYIALPATSLHTSDHFLGETLYNIDLWRQCSRERKENAPSPIVFIHHATPSVADRVLYGHVPTTVRYDIESSDFDRLAEAASDSRSTFADALAKCTKVRTT